jgi:hypothetical protein
VNYDNDKFIHAPTYTYNEAMQLLEPISVVEYNIVPHLHLPTYIFTSRLVSIYLSAITSPLTLHTDTTIMKSS